MPIIVPFGHSLTPSLVAVLDRPQRHIQKGNEEQDDEKPIDGENSDN